jgi:hypothetical protein
MSVIHRARVIALAVAALPPMGLCAAGCATDRPARPPLAQRRLVGAVLSERDVPTSYLPAETTAIFRGLRAADPGCRTLLVLTDRVGDRVGGGVGGDVAALAAMPRAETAFYQVDPGAAVAEQLLEAPPVPAHEFLLSVRRAAERCGRIIMRTRSYTIVLRRIPLVIRGIGEESLTVRYVGRAGVRQRVSVDIVTARAAAGRLLIFTSVTLGSSGRARGARTGRDVAIRIAERAVGKAGGATSIG